MEDNFQMIFNVVAVALIFLVMLVVSYRSKLAKAVGINPAKEQATFFAETIGAGVLIGFLIFTVFAVGYWGN
jgi:hypothetical protein